MSAFRTVSVRCPQCRVATPARLWDTLNAERMPEARSLLLERRLHRGTCSGCRVPFVVDKPLLYVDPALRLWIHCAALDGRASFAAHEAELHEVFAKSVRNRRLPAYVRQLGETLRPSLVFGYEELRERILLASAGLDPATVELLKREVLLQTPSLHRDDVATLTVDAVDPTRLWMRVEYDGGTTGPVVEVERAPYEALSAQQASLAPLYPGLFGPGWQSLRRYRAGAPRPPASAAG